MKKILLVLGFCSFVSVASIAQLNKVAIISVWGDKNLSDNPMDTKMYEKLMKDTSFNISSIVYQFDELMRNDVIPQFPFPFMPKEEVVATEGYQDLIELSTYKHGVNTYYIVPAKDYVPLAAFGVGLQDDEAILKSFELLPDDIDGVMIAYINFNMVDAGGVGPYSAKKVQAYCNIKIFNKAGKRIFKLKESAPSDKKVSAVGGIITEPKKITPLVLQASDNLFADIKKTLPKKLAKMAKKIDKSKED